MNEKMKIIRAIPIWSIQNENSLQNRLYQSHKRCQKSVKMRSPLEEGADDAEAGIDDDSSLCNDQ